MKIYRCNICGNIVMVLNDSGVNPVCCGVEMELLIPSVEEQLMEKHLPEVKKASGMAIVEVKHVSQLQHYIMFIILETEKGCYIRNIGPNKRPLCSFRIDFDEKVLRAYEYCNIHGLFMKECSDEKNKDC